MWLATPTSGPDQNCVTYQLQIQPLSDEGEEPREEDYHTLEYSFNISNMKVREGGVGRERVRAGEAREGEEEVRTIILEAEGSNKGRGREGVRTIPYQESEWEGDRERGRKEHETIFILTTVSETALVIVGSLSLPPLPPSLPFSLPLTLSFSCLSSSPTPLS